MEKVFFPSDRCSSQPCYTRMPHRNGIEKEESQRRHPVSHLPDLNHHALCNTEIRKAADTCTGIIDIRLCFQKEKGVFGLTFQFLRQY